MKPTVLTFLITLTLSNFAFAQDDFPWPPGSAMYVGREYSRNIEYFEIRLNKKHQELIQLIKESDPRNSASRLITAIDNVHKSWQQFKVQECALMGALSGAGGSWPTTHALRCEANLTHRRYLAVRSAIKCIQRVRPKDLPFQIDTCLYQLGSLSIGK